MAFLNSPMLEVWKATKRTFADLMDVDTSALSKTDDHTDSRSRQSNVGRANVRHNRSVNKVNTRPETTVWTTSSGGSGSRSGDGSAGSTSVTPDSGNNCSNLAQSNAIVRRSESPDETAKLNSRVSTVSLGQCSSMPRPNASEENKELQLSPSQLQSQVQDRFLTDFSSKTNVKNTTRSKCQPVSQSETKLKHHKLHILPSGFSPPRNKTQLTSPSGSRSLEYNDINNPICNYSQTVPELGLYPHYANYQPREPTVKDLPVLTGVEPSDIQRQILTREITDEQNISHDLVVDHTRSSRTRNKSMKERFRSSSSDRASEMKLIQRTQSYNKSRTIDTRRSDDDDDDDWLEQAEKVKLKFMSMWNNVKYGWTVKMKTPFNIHKAIWLLGKCYHHRPEDPDLDKVHPGLNTVRSPAMELFKQDFVSRIWLTYRREFPQLSGSTLTTDCGWGCMLRSGQMLLAQSLVLHFLGRDWNLYKEQTLESDKLHRQIIQWFGDQPSDMSPFSVHHLVEIGKHSGKRAGDWFGPASVAHIIKEAVDQAPELNPLLDSICIYVSQDCTVYKQDVIDLCTRRRKKSLKPIYHDIPESNSVGSDTTDLLRDEISRPSAEAKKLLFQQNSLSSFEVIENESGNFENMCNKGENTPSSTTGEGRYTSAGSSNVDRETNVSDDSFEAVLRNLDSDLDKYSSSYEGRDRDDKQLNDNASVDSHPNKSMKDEVSVSGPDAVQKRSPEKGTIDKETPISIDQTSLDKLSQEDKRSSKYDEDPKNSQDEVVRKKEQVEMEKEGMKNAKDVKGHTEEKNDDVTHSNNSNSPTDEYSSDWCAVIILVPVRLGGEEVNSIYIRPIQSLFSMDNCIGIIGGKPKHSLYFVGFQDEKLVHLDPHYCQSVVDMKEKHFPIWTFHCMTPRKMAIAKMDPSCTIGFYLKTRDDFDKFCIEIQNVINPPGNGKNYPMFIIREGRCRDWNAQHATSAKSERYLRVRHVNEDGKLICPVTAAEDFVLLD